MLLNCNWYTEEYRKCFRISGCSQQLVLLLCLLQGVSDIDIAKQVELDTDSRCSEREGYKHFLTCEVTFLDSTSNSET